MTETIPEILVRHAQELQLAVNREIAKGLPRKVNGKSRSIREIAMTVALEYGLKIDDLRGYSRKQPTASARQRAYFLARNEGHSYPAIGRYFNRDHATVIHGVNRWKSGECRKPDGGVFEGDT